MQLPYLCLVCGKAFYLFKENKKAANRHSTNKNNFLLTFILLLYKKLTINQCALIFINHSFLNKESKKQTQLNSDFI